MLEDLIMQCLAKDPAERPPHVDAIIDVLDAIPDVPVWTEATASQWWADHVATRPLDPNAETTNVQT